ncbi:hypothetical protein Y032_0008g224 [Ancylostoma ceylanicum]|uniref:Secreted protein n=1 Tax=Ancylostoma ceylanicum TaxID=53326 RepID=A0A016VLF4_9BILA|nr:hypothetical protein Y032_0008g224 [Ancylostoma ceylanicum]
MLMCFHFVVTSLCELVFVFSNSTRAAAASHKSSRSQNGTASRSVREDSELRGHDNLGLDYGSTEMVMLGVPYPEQPHVTRIAVRPDDV